MSVKETILQVTVAALSVIGFYGILHALFEILLTPRELAVAVVSTRALPPEALDILLCEARRTPVGRGKRVLLLLPTELWEGEMRSLPAYTEIIEKYGVAVCLLDAPPTEP